MPKKKISSLEETTTTTLEERVEVVSDYIFPLELDLGRQDLNLLVEKLNEVIEKVNK